MNIFKNVLNYYRIILPLIIVLKYLLYKFLQNIHSYSDYVVLYENKSLHEYIVLLWKILPANQN